MRSNRWIAVAALAAVLGGCGKSETPPPEKPAPVAEPSKAPIVPKKEIVDWCREHGVPESVCTRCNAGLVAEFKKKGDWCGEHNVPESQCIPCHPELEAKFKAMAPK